jgi:molybdenum-dependent DNA-binding transcriptional regulator ModE
MIVDLYHWSRLELRHVVALQTVVEAGSFWAAADRLDTSQSALSQQIAALEHVVGARLVERSRGRRSIGLTEAGEIFLRHAAAIVARLSAAHTDFAALAKGAAGTLRVGTFESSGTRILPLVLRAFRRAWPKVDIRLTEAAKDDQLLSLVERGELDVSFAIFPLDESQSGVGRTGRWFAVEHAGVVPDIITTSKSLGGGVPLSGVTTTHQIADRVQELGYHQSSSHTDDPFLCAVGLANIEIIEDEGLVENAAVQGDYLKLEFEEMMRRHEIVGDVRGIGLMLGIEIVSDKLSKTSSPHHASAMGCCSDIALPEP